MEDFVRYLEEIVEPTIADFEQNARSVRHAFLACVTVFHAVDYLAFPGTSRGTREDFRRDSPDFKLVDDIAHAFKHVRAGNPRNPRLSAKAVVSRPSGAFGQFAFGVSRFGDDTGEVTVTTNVRIDVLQVVKKAATFLHLQVQANQT
jgi:hypothetical protein